jgi:hypothetical protein
MTPNPTSTLKLLNPKTGVVVYQLNKKTKAGKYSLDPASPQYKFTRTIAISGFTSFPSGFKRNGGGLPSRGYLLLKSFSEKLKPFRLIVDNTKPTSIKKQKGRHNIVINHDDLRLILQSLRKIQNTAYDDQRTAIMAFLNEKFPKNFKSAKANSSGYRKDALAGLLSEKGIIDRLSPQDIDKLAKFFPTFIERHGDRLKGAQKLIVISNSKKAAEVVYIEKIVKEYERRLKAKTHNENTWQEFLSEYILIFNSNYASQLEKESIALHGKYPDFLLLDAYNYLDIYEIKKPNTPLLKKDKSRGNYYWDAELAKAISQVENYMHYAERNGATLREEIKRQKSIDVRVMKPRGFIIAGERKQLQGEIMEDNFRLLNNSLKNVEIILYDELLTNLKRFLKRLKKN